MRPLKSWSSSSNSRRDSGFPLGLLWWLLPLDESRRRRGALLLIMDAFELALLFDDDVEERGGLLEDDRVGDPADGDDGGEVPLSSSIITV